MISTYEIDIEVSPAEMECELHFAQDEIIDTPMESLNLSVEDTDTEVQKER